MLRDAMMAVCRLLPPAAEHYLRWQYYRYRYPKSFEHLQLLRNCANSRGYTLNSTEKLKCIFIHVPKCAGISIARSLFGDNGPGHRRAEHYQITYSPREYAAFFKFAFVRNPWDRLASAYFFLKSGGMNVEDGAFADKHLARYNSFEAFVADWLNPQNVTLYYHFQPQVYYVCVNGRAPELDFIGYFENLHADFEFVRDRLRVKADLAFLNKTNGKRGDYKSLYNDQMIRIVADVYAGDIATLGYTFDNSSLAQQLAKRCRRQLAPG